MSEIQFSKNFSDLSVQQGTNAGFQFDFYCERCSDTWRSEFVSYTSGQASGWLGKAAGMFGGVLGSVGSAVDGLAQAGFGHARDEAFVKAIENAKHHFHRCGKCQGYVCDRCWNTAKGLCYNCAPDVEVEIEAARNQGEIQAATENAAMEGQKRGGTRDVGRDRQLVCPACHAETHGAKFCPSCGHKLASSDTCAGCGAALPAGSRFCPECGQKAG
ncbi:MAG: zinc ribbon domain-containing protein [Rhodocyclaceae bacterium]|nr:zinc ribbon domain-containing protein [Rhodocyclaceae bacterium]